MTSLFWACGVASFLLSAMLVGWVRRYALRAAILDEPNQRSSHSVTTPRGGGAGLVGAMLLTLCGAGVAGAVPTRMMIALLGLAGIALVGWFDDRSSLPISVRLAAHAAAAVTLLPVVWTPGAGLSAAAGAGLAFWAFVAVAAVNVVNFMDGIDGLIGSQALLFGTYLAIRSGDGPAALLGIVMAAAAAGFLLWNWPPARIFLGDSGSGALGFAMVVGGASLVRSGAANTLLTFLPLGPLCLDAAVTLVRRAVRGERLTQAHRSHLYQRLANGGWGHGRVTILYAAAALLGMAVTAVPAGARAVTLVLYAGTILGVGALLDRRVPLKASAAAAPAEPSLPTTANGETATSHRS